MVLGVTFLMHGIVKFQSGIGNIAGWFESIGLPGFLAYAVAVIELAGGIALIIGLGTRIVSVLIALIMIGAILKVKLAAGFLGSQQAAGYELDLMLLAVSILLALSGSKLFALDKLFVSSNKTSVKM
ncbi:DoxX family protein [Paenibacillus alkalitolerans]|uniref:DoxX family protein n=1 Tax=Paenibacillus alkalitolerans TaxID=2799335 RepID=UPI002D7E833D|nr:DoxX family protein [Paenibacillus alkalitolerans]